ncbi:acyl-CoA dehydrogenase [Blastomyces dermatitidis ER-3]|uniref:Acyl-CoA dehydrogenase n=3 Tax=Blastomyces TaxID=229219 RepID=A0A179UG85_BLAGS|nr:acyl-CoA dehydrogenase [Blastomyces gilchristii SLH14081]XP_045275225.1 acyl-CoA dehydrogenase [Blastomyces dermatitidis ER-3]EGE79602.2 acyl-CoA dehydrogenase [Blastomyces dermatitidis ATCC 18188]EQL32545.1 acyl-CoA dehydrogenase [Blastomyces dermatitidis ATCC 26199]EEQ87997.2 acyl-CoA dehydrogenase [Blastomyces dermatitidis ER-3]OAT06167.1 acyl-CoA dehydrogenase [Blastomyces gilchristii SLH14081]
MSEVFSKDAVTSHNKPDNLWIIIDEDVYDLTKFQDEHPGGKKILQRVAGKDASKQFWKYHNAGVLKKYSPQLKVGSLDSKKVAAAPPPPPSPPATPPAAGSSNSENAVASRTAAPVALEPYGDLVPFADPAWYQGYTSMYYNETHAALRKEVREWVESEIDPHVHDWDEAKAIPEHLYKQMGDRGYLAGLMGVAYEPALSKNQVKCVPPEKWDFFHELIVTDELSRAASGGLVWNLIGGFGIGCPPVIKYGKKELVQRILPAILSGDKRICLAITEPDCGSDVSNISCEAKLTPDGRHYIVNGEKKWITNGIWADYFTTAVRTGEPGMNGISVLLIERSAGGVSTRKMDCQGMSTSGTAYVTFEDVKVPVENLIGKGNQGFKGR